MVSATTLAGATWILTCGGISSCPAMQPFTRNHRNFPVSLLPNHDNVKKVKGNDLIFKDRFRVQVRSKPATTVTSHIGKDDGLSPQRQYGALVQGDTVRSMLRHLLHRYSDHCEDDGNPGLRIRLTCAWGRSNICPCLAMRLYRVEPSAVTNSESWWP